MIKGLLTYTKNNVGIFNIGDYIQSIAARQFIGKPDCYIERERLKDYNGDEVKLIMNGWYMHHPENWPPSDKIEPLFVALHINKLAEKEMTSSESIEYFKKYQPIGCRDFHTVRLLEAHGVKAYFSGCLTLTLGKTYRHNQTEEGKIYITDLGVRLKKNTAFKLKCLLTIISKYNLLKNIQQRMLQCGVHQEFKSIVAFYVTFCNVISDDVMLKAYYRAQEIKDNFESQDAKFKYADELLKEYASAKMVITTRIHCALPCLAMNTPVVFVTNSMIGEVNNCRLDGLKELFHTISIKEDGITCNVPGISKITSSSTFKNKDDYKLLASKLAAKCEKFVAGNN